jgi:hypothetical protein
MYSDDLTANPTNVSLTGKGALAGDVGVMIRYSFENNLDDTTTDGVTNDTLTVQAGAATYVAGVVGQAAVFNGNYFTAPDSADNDLVGDTWTIEAFIKRSAPNPAPLWDRLFLKWGGGYHYALDIGHFDLHTSAGNVIDNVNTAPATDFGDGSWHHVAISSDGSTSKAYIDGSNVYTGAAILLSDTATALGVGDMAASPDAGGRFTGWMDEVLFYNVGKDQTYIDGRVALLPGEIEAAPATLDYGTVGLSTTNVLSVTVTNTGLGVLSITNFAFAGSNTFSLAAGVTTGQLAVGGSTNITVEYKPGLSVATHMGTLIIGSDDRDNATTNINLTGTASDNSLTLTSVGVSNGTLTAGDATVFADLTSPNGTVSSAQVWVVWSDAGDQGTNSLSAWPATNTPATYWATGATVTVDFDGRLDPDTEYTFRLFATNNPTAWSAAGTVTTLGAETVPVTGGLTLWLAADQLGLNHGDGVSSFTDSSGSGNHAGNGVAGTFTTNAINGKPVVRFDTSQYLYTTTSFTMPYTIVHVAKMQEVTGMAKLRLIAAADGNRLYGHWSGFRDQLWLDGAYRLSTGEPAAGTDPHVYAATVVNGGPTGFYGDGNPITATGNPNQSSDMGRLRLNGYGIGIAEMSDCDVAEVLIYDRILSASELTLVGSYLEDKYGLDTAYPKYAGDIQVAPDSLAYGNVLTNTTDTLSVTVNNIGVLPLNITNFAFTGSNTFALATGITTGQVAAGGSTNIAVEYTPTSEATHSGTLVIHSDDPTANPTNVSLTGTGITAAQAAIVIRYSFESNLTDTALGGVADDSLTVQAGAATYVDGVVGQAAVFNGNYFTAPDSVDNDLVGNTWTIEAFIKRDGAAPLWDRMFLKWSGGYHYALNNGHLDLHTSAGNVINDVNTAPATDFGDGQWHHVAITSDGSSTRAYIDAKNVYTGAAILLPDTATVLGVGDMPSSPSAGSRFTGWMDEVLFHNVGVDQSYIISRYLVAYPLAPPTLFIVR